VWAEDDKNPQEKLSPNPEDSPKTNNEYAHALINSARVQKIGKRYMRFPEKAERKTPNETTKEIVTQIKNIIIKETVLFSILSQSRGRRLKYVE